MIFNVKGEDLMFADKPNARLSDDDAKKYEQLGLPCGPFADVGLWAPASKSGFEIVHTPVRGTEGVDGVRLVAAGVLPGPAAALPLRRRRRRDEPALVRRHHGRALSRTTQTRDQSESDSRCAELDG